MNLPEIKETVLWPVSHFKVNPFISCPIGNIELSELLNPIKIILLTFKFEFLFRLRHYNNLYRRFYK